MGSFVGPEDIEQEILDEGNAKLKEQFAELEKNRTKAQALQPQINFDPLSLAMLRMNLLIDYVLPPMEVLSDDPALTDEQRKNTGTFGNPDRIEFEQRWNEALLNMWEDAFGQYEKMKEEMRKQQIVAGVVPQGGVVQGSNIRELADRFKNPRLN